MYLHGGGGAKQCTHHMGPYLHLVSAQLCSVSLMNHMPVKRGYIYLSLELSACSDWTHMPQNSALQVVPVFLVVRAFRPGFNSLFPGRISWFLGVLMKKCFPPLEEGYTENKC